MAKTKIEKPCPKCKGMAEWNDYYCVWHCKVCETIYTAPFDGSPSIENIIEWQADAFAAEPDAGVE